LNEEWPETQPTDELLQWLLVVLNIAIFPIDTFSFEVVEHRHDLIIRPKMDGRM